MPLSKFFTDREADAADAALSEANHRIANNLALVYSLLRIQGEAIAKGPDPIPRESARMIVVEAAAQVEAISRLHRLLSTSEAGGVDCGTYLQSVCEAAMKAAGGAQRAELRFTCPPDRVLPLAQVAPLGLIIVEAVINALKHAHPANIPGCVTVTCQLEGDGALSVKVADNGVGLPEAFDPVRDGGTGLRIMRTLARQLGAAPLFETSALGLTIHLKIPAPAG